MPQLIVEESARDDVASIAATIAEDDLAAALRFYDAAAQAFEFLSENPGAALRLIRGLPRVRICVSGRSLDSVSIWCFISQ